MNPEVNVTLDLVDGRRIDFLADEADLAVRTGNVGGDMLVARFIATQPVVLFASLVYLAANETPVRIEELSAYRLPLTSDLGLKSVELTVSTFYM